MKSLLACCLVLVLVGCSSGSATSDAASSGTQSRLAGPQSLTRPIAAALIQKNPWMAERPTFTFREGKQCVAVENGRMGEDWLKLQNLNIGVHFLEYRNLEAKDWQNDRDFFADQMKCIPTMGQWIVVTLTEKGRERSKQWQGNADGSYTVTLGSREFIEVTGITDGADGLKIAEFSWRWKATTDVDDAFFLEREGPQGGTARFRLYDDGWRLLSVQ